MFLAGCKNPYIAQGILNDQKKRRRIQQKRRKVVTKTITETRDGYITTETTTSFSDTPIIINKEKIVCPIKPIQPLRVTKSIKPIQKPQVNIEDEYIIC